jgi:hypothetical protein
MKVSDPVRKIVLIFIVISAVSINLYILIESIVFPERLTPDISRYEQRFQTSRQVLPQRGIVGYISDDTADDSTSTARIYIARYSLSPLILVRSLDYPLVIGNFYKPNPDLEIYRKQGLIPLKDSGNGVVLFKREFR